MASDDFGAIFANLRERMLRAAPDMKVAEDQPGTLVLHAPWPHPTRPKEPMWFGGIVIKKNYVSYHLMPVYSHRALKAGLSPELARRMQGKSCFNFKKVDEGLFAELEGATAKGAATYASPFEMQLDC